MPDGGVTGAAGYGAWASRAFVHSGSITSDFGYIRTSAGRRQWRGAFSCIVLESAIMSCLPRGFPTQRVFIKQKQQQQKRKTLHYSLYLVANGHLSKFGSILEATDGFIGECIVRNFTWLLSLIRIVNVLVQTVNVMVVCNNVQLVHSRIS